MSTANWLTCHIGGRTAKAEILEECRVIIWDECIMPYKVSWEVLDGILWDVQCNNLIGRNLEI